MKSERHLEIWFIKQGEVNERKKIKEQTNKGGGRKQQDR
jgi:hypothetical protein